MSVTDNLERYQEVAPLGSGGMATVVLATDTLLGRQVALKRLSPATDLRHVTRLRREALIGASVSHPNLVSIYDVLTPGDGGVVIVMEYVPGETLRDALRREGKLPAPEVLRILDGAAAALDAIHARGIVHRDVKPPNILLGPGGTIKLADLGIASVPDGTRITSAGTVLGSFRYMAPEQLDESPATPAIDIYALAAVAFEALSGRKARQEPNAIALAHAIATSPPPDLRDAWPDAAPAAAKLLKRAMSRDPADRPRSAGDLMRRLRGALEPRETIRGSIVRPAAAAPTAVSAVREPPQQRPGGAAGKPAAASPRAPERAGDGAAARRRPRGAVPEGPPARRSERSLFAALALAVVAGAVVLAVLLNTGGSGKPRPAASSRSLAQRPARKSAAAKPATGASPASRSTPGRSAAGTTGASGASTAQSASRATAGAATGAVGAVGAAPTTATASPSAIGSSASATSRPVGTVESFYELAASHQYSRAWTLADPNFRNQLGGYGSFAAGQAGDRSITFNSARVLRQSAGMATVSLSTTSVRDDGTHHCAGTADLVPNGASGTWVMHAIQISCS